MARNIYYVKSIHRSHETIWEGTIEYLSKNVFGYTLGCGHSWNNRISTNPRTIKGLVDALNRSAYECKRYHDHYEISCREEFDLADQHSKVAMHD